MSPFCSQVSRQNWPPMCSQTAPMLYPWKLFRGAILTNICGAPRSLASGWQLKASDIVGTNRLRNMGKKGHRIEIRHYFSFVWFDVFEMFHLWTNCHMRFEKRHVRTLLFGPDRMPTECQFTSLPDTHVRLIRGDHSKKLLFWEYSLNFPLEFGMWPLLEIWICSVMEILLR